MRRPSLAGDASFIEEAGFFLIAPWGTLFRRTAQPRTGKIRLDAILQKLGTAARAEAVAIALRKHLLKI